MPLHSVLACDNSDTSIRFYSESLAPLAVPFSAVGHPRDLHLALERDPSIRLLILDLEFPTDEGNLQYEIIGHRSLPELRQRYPDLKIVIATTMGAAVYDIIVDAQRRKLFDEWIDLKGRDAQLELRTRVAAHLFPFGRSSERGLWLLHLSDLHFGNAAQFEFWGTQETDGALNRAMLRDMTSAKVVAPSFPGRADLVCVSGDVTDKARPSEYEAAAVFLRDMMRDCIDNTGSPGPVEQERCVIAPGNHDVNWDISRARDLYRDRKRKSWKVATDAVPSPTEKDLKYLEQYQWAPFGVFLDSLGVREPDCSEKWLLTHRYQCAAWDLASIGALVFVANSSAHRVNHREQKPEIGSATLTTLEKWAATRKARPRGLPRIFMTHHSLGSTAPDKDRAQVAGLGTLRREIVKSLGASICLTGHMHEQVCETVAAGSRNLLCIGAGSTGKIDARGAHTEPLGYNLIHMSAPEVGGTEHVEVSVFPRLMFRGEFVAHPTQPGDTHRLVDGLWQKVGSGKPS
jgi:hypothetical protein